MFVLTRPYTVVSVLIKVNKDYWVKTVFFVMFDSRNKRNGYFSCFDVSFANRENKEFQMRRCFDSVLFFYSVDCLLFMISIV